MERLEAVINDVVFQSDDKMFCVLRAENKSFGHFCLVYHGPAPYLGENVSVDGNWIEHPRFGKQFDAKVLTTIQPTSVAGIELSLIHI